jgi:hypothetical protein
MDIIEIERPSSAYIILESKSKEKRVSKGLYLIHTLLPEEIAKLVKKL